MNRVVLTLILTIAFGTSVPMNAQQLVNERIHEKAVNQKAPRVSFAGKQAMPQLFRSTAAGVTADFSCQSAGSAVTVWEEDFDDGSAGWTLTNAESFSWELKKITDTSTLDKDFAAYDPDDVQSLFIEGPFRFADRDIASATSPLLDVPGNAMLKGYIGFSQNMDDYCRLHISVSTDAFVTSELLWNSADENGEKPWRWHEFTVSLEKYAGQQVQIRFTYTSGKDDTFNTGGYMGDFAIDGLQMTGVSAIEQVEVNTGEVIAFADMSTGAPTAWQWSFPGGTPATSTEQNPRVYYTRDGVYDVTLTVSNADGSDTKTRTAFVKVTGTAPVARILPPATFRYSETRLPMVAPLVGVQYRDNSTGYPTAWEWTFDGVSPEAYAQVTSTEQNPIVGYNYRHQQAVALHVENEHGGSDDAIDVSVEYNGLITTFAPGDVAATFDLEARGTFPGTNKMGITAYAEKFSKPSRPILVFGAYVYFVTASATSLTDQIADVGVHLCTSENGLPGKKLDSMWWSVFELDTPSGTSLIGTEFEFNPTVIDDEFFIVVDGIPEKNDSVDVSFAMAKFRDHGNTAYMYKDKEWVDVSTYFPAGANHTSYMIMPSIVHSVMSPIPVDRGPLVVGKQAGTSKYPFFSIYGYETPIKSDADWCRVVGQPNGLTLDTLQISYDRLPDGIEERVATLTLTDSISTYDIQVIQNASGISAIENVSGERVSIYPSVFNQEVTVCLPEGARRVMVSDEKGRELYRQELNGCERQITVDASAWATGVYFVRVLGEREVTVVKGVKR